MGSRLWKAVLDKNKLIGMLVVLLAFSFIFIVLLMPALEKLLGSTGQIMSVAIIVLFYGFVTWLLVKS